MWLRVCAVRAKLNSSHKSITNNFSKIIYTNNKKTFQDNSWKVFSVNVGLEGVDPSFKQAINKLSTCLVFISCRRYDC